MNLHHSNKQSTLMTRTLAGAVAAAVAGVTLVAPSTTASAQAATPGHRSLARVLAADKGYDHDWSDFDILEKAVTTVLAAKPDSPVKVLTQGRTRLTAFLPTDRAFRHLATDLTGHRPRTERGTFRAIARAAGVDTLETVLLYHVVVGRTLGSGKVAKLDGTAVATAAGPTVTVLVRHGKVVLADQDHDARNARVVAVDINKGNKQIAHAVNRVLRPIDL